MKANNGIQIDRYRWVVLAILCALSMAVQLHFLIFASITGEAAKFYHVSDFQINVIAIIFLIVLAALSIPAAHVINKIGLHKGIGIGAVIMGVFALVKGFFADNFTIVLCTELLIALAQPFIVNASTRVSAVWFPAGERGVITGVLTLAQFVGMGIALSLTPLLVSSYGMTGMIWIYGIISLVASAIFLIFMRSAPKTPSCIEGEDVRVGTSEGLKTFFQSRSAVILLFTFFVGIGVYNAISSCLEQILRTRSFSYEAIGLLGGLMLGSAIVGSFVWALLSDKINKRKPVLIAGSILFIPSLLIINLAYNHTLILLASIVLGLAVGIGGLGYQYAAELTKPAPETVSQSIIQIAGSVSGVLFVIGMNAFGNYIKEALLIFTFMIFVAVLLQFKLKESL